MSVVLETSVGDIVIDLYYKTAPLAAKNFLKLCKMKFYNGTLFYNIQKDYLASIRSLNKPTTIYGEDYFEDQTNNHLRHDKIGVVSTANQGPNKNNSDFFITLSSLGERLNHKHSIFGQVMEGIDVLEKINQTFVDDNNRPLLNIRIKHTHILDDPFDDVGFKIPSRSPSPHYKAEGRFEYEDKNILQAEDDDALIKKAKEHQSKKRAVVLEILEDIPDADMKPPENVLYICKLNPVTEEKDLEIIFSKFGGIKSCHVVRDWKTGMSLQYAFIEFETINSCEEAYSKMENALIDDRRIHVDFCQSAFKQWQSAKKQQRQKNELKNMREQRLNKGKNVNLIEQLHIKKDYFNPQQQFQMVIDPQQPIIQQPPPPPKIKEEIKKVIKKRESSSSSQSSSSSSRNHKRKHKKKYRNRR